MQKGMFALLLVTLCMMPTLASAQDAVEAVAAVAGDVASTGLEAASNVISTGLEATGQVFEAFFGIPVGVMTARRSYTPPMDITAVLTAQY